MFQRKLTDYLLYASIAMLLFASGYKYGQWQITSHSRVQNSFTVLNADSSTLREDKNRTVDFKLFWDTWEKLNEKYIDSSKLNTSQMYYGAIKGMVASLGDPYTFFLTPDENKKSKDDLGGKLEGIGAQLGLKDSHVVVMSPMKNSPAMKAGVRAGDYVLKVDGKDARNWTLAQTVSKIRGPKGTKVTLTLGRQSDTLDIAITRDELHIPSIELSYEKTGKENVAVIKINLFGDSTNDEWDAAASQVADKYAAGTIKGMVLDVRNNPGGYLESAVHIASEFLQLGDVVVKQETTTGNDKVYTVEREGKLRDIPLMVLINGGSASAAEILSGSLRDHGRTKLVGEKSFGKGSVQEPIDMDGGSGLHVTVAKWILPKGDWINGKGLQPAVAIKPELNEGNTVTNATDNQLQKAMELVAQ